MRNVGTAIIIGILVVVMGLYLVCFQVRETETALVTRFGKPVREITKPGVYWKLPIPIHRVYKFDSRMRVLEAPVRETTTRGAVPIIVNTYIVWRIVEPLKFFQSIGTVKEAENKLISQISDTQNRIIGQHPFADFVNSDPQKIRLQEIEQQMLADLRGPVRDNYGIEVKTLGIKQLKVSEDVSKAVFDRMKAERKRRTEATIAQGKAEAAKIKSDAELKRAVLLAAATARAKAIRGQGDAEAAKYYKMLEEDPELAMFLRDLEALQKILEKRSTIVLSGDSEPFKLLKEMPKIKPKATK